jgi:hypothetical protein
MILRAAEEYERRGAASRICDHSFVFELTTDNAQTIF